MRLLFLFFFAFSAAAQPCDRIFDAPPRYLSGVVRDVLTADYDMDGRPDLLAARQAEADETPGLVPLWNHPRGFAPGATVPLPGNTLRLWPEDANGDGRIDAIAMGANFIATVLSNGNGTFRTVVTNVTGDALQQFASTYGNFDGDGRGDLAVGVTRGNRTGFLRLFRRQSDGTFVENTPQPQLTRQLVAAVSGDVNADGKLDVVYADRQQAGYLPGNGDGTFGAQQVLGPSTLNGVAAGDFDEDGRDDVISASIHLSTKNFEGTPFDFRTRLYTVVDLEGDGKLDLMSGGTVLRGKGDGTFTEVQSGPVGYAGRHVLADFDRDGRLDDAANGEGVIIRYGLPGGGFSGGSMVQSYFQNGVPRVGDFNGDGRDDVVTTPGGIIYLSGPDGRQQLSGESPTFLTAFPGDFNGDGFDDVVLIAGTVFMVPGNAAGTFGGNTVRTDGLSASYPVDAVAADLNGDGKLDLAALNGSEVMQLLGDGTGRFAAGPTATARYGERIAAADFNRDGRVDLAVQGLDALYVIDGNAPTTAITVSTIHSTGLAVADVDRDALPDLVVTGEDPRELLVFSGNGNLTFRAPRAVARFEADARPDVTAADFSGDGRIDFFITYTADGHAQYLVQQPDGSFFPEQKLFTEEWTGAMHGDFDGDGHPDVAYAATLTGTVYVHLSRCRESLRIAPPHVRLAASGRTLELQLPSDAEGNATFFRDGQAFAVAPVVNGRALITTTLPNGTYRFSAIYWGHERWSRADSQPVAHTLTDGKPKRRSARH